MLGYRGAEGGQHDGAGDPVPGGDGQGVPGVVIEPGQDLGAGSVCQRVVGEVRLPALVGQLGLKPQVGRLRPLAWLGGDQPCAGQIAADGRRRHPDAMVMFQVPGDRAGTGVQALPSQVLAQLGNQADRRIRDSPR
jgi:hypothetical protein